MCDDKNCAETFGKLQKKCQELQRHLEKACRQLQHTVREHKNIVHKLKGDFSTRAFTCPYDWVLLDFICSNNWFLLTKIFWRYVLVCYKCCLGN